MSAQDQMSSGTLFSCEMCTQGSITNFAAVFVVSKVPSRDIEGCLPLVKFPEDAVMRL